MAGWCWQWVAQLDCAPDSWVAPLDVVRIPPTEDAVSATIDQIRRLVGLLPDDRAVPLFVLDADYDPIALSAGLKGCRASVLVRIRSDRVFYAAPDPSPVRTVGRPRRHGKRFGLSQPDTLAPDACLTTSDPRYGTVKVTAWSGLHPKLSGRGRWAGSGVPPIVAGTVIRVEVEHLPRPKRGVKVLWLWWSGPGVPDLDVCWRAYLRRFDIEHAFRFAKQTLGWTAPALQTPRPMAAAEVLEDATQRSRRPHDEV